MLNVPGWLRYRLYAIVIVVLISGAFLPELAGITGHWHTELHLLTFALISMLSCWAWPALPLRWQLLPATVLPVVQEVCIMYGYQQALAWQDILLDMAGGLLGIAIVGTLLRRRAS
ncbi:hypothetical protein [Gallaecimonas sp. GXIMD1310]|uniref:hypothetical protein n=1 Tax=Gallaecimonas sp. GXIMD1310 TaxID=3131926 RepID=UPI003245D183